MRVVFATFLLLGKIPDTHRGGNVYFSSWFVEGFVCSQPVSRQDDLAEGHHRKQSAAQQIGSSLSDFAFYLYIPSGCKSTSKSTQSHPKLCSTNHWTNPVTVHPWSGHFTKPLLWTHKSSGGPLDMKHIGVHNTQGTILKAESGPACKLIVGFQPTELWKYNTIVYSLLSLRYFVVVSQRLRQQDFMMKWWWEWENVNCQEILCDL